MKSIRYCLVVFFLLINSLLFAQNQPLLHLQYNANYTPTYDEVIDMYRLLDKHYANARLFEKGLTDLGKPLHLFVINNEPEFNPEKIRQQGKTILMINNGIHPGEPEGIDASLMFADDILRNKDGLAELLDNTVIIIIPVYNIGGHLNRSAYNRSGQTTPYETGFRGNFKNLDLNRDFTKCDSENAKSFTKIFTEWNPDAMLDTHTTNGSDHQYTITLISPEPDLFPLAQDKFLRKKFIPDLYSGMKKGKYELIPYVVWMNNDPKKGIVLWKDGARYSSGFASLFNCYGMVTENHIYKDYPDRVESCYQFIETLAKFTSKHSEAIIKLRREGEKESMSVTEYPVAYELDSTQFQMIDFKGYEADDDIVSPVTGVNRFGYDRSKPFTAQIPYYDTWKPTEFVRVPEFYILPQAYEEVIERLRNAGVSYSMLKNDTVIEVTVDYIDKFTSPKSPYNGHYYHSEVQTNSEVQKIAYYKGDLLIPVRQKPIKYILEMLEPKAIDSFFRWNFFDNILDQREYFSSYGFEENALKYLKEHPDFNRKFQEKRKSDADFAQNHRAQLAYIYNNSEWSEKTWKRYPVGKIFR